MSPQPPIPGPLWDTVPPEAQAALQAAFDALRQQIDRLERRVRDLEARLKLNSTNSSRPPSSDPIGLKRKPPKPKGRRKRGGQPGHRWATRALVPPERLHSSTDCLPEVCRRCGEALHGDDPAPLIQQVAEPPRIEPIVDEYRLHRLRASGDAVAGAEPARYRGDRGRDGATHPPARRIQSRERRGGAGRAARPARTGSRRRAAVPGGTRDVPTYAKSQAPVGSCQRRPDALVEAGSVFALELGVSTAAGLVGLEEDVLITAAGSEFLSSP